MERFAYIYKNLLLTAILGLLFLPLFESETEFLRVKPLQGAVIKKTYDVKLSPKNWFDGYYQEQKGGAINDSFGFRNIFIRINNQVDYSLFNKTHAENIVIGKNGYLFESHYIDGYMGTDLIGEDQIKTNVEQLNFINDTLKKLHKSLILIIAPNKAAFYPEYLPDEYKTPGKVTNYGTYLYLLKKSTLDYIDFNSYFINNKNKSKYLLIPKNGTHWSIYGSALAADSLIRYIEKVQHITMPHTNWNNNVTLRSDTLFDVDVESIMNLLVNLKSPLMAYPIEKPENADSDKTRPGVLIVGDSYYWGLDAAHAISHSFSSNSHFWYYFKKLVEHKDVSQQEIRDEIASQNVIIILATAHNWGSLGWGFIEATYDMFKGINPSKNNSDYLKKIDEIKDAIRNDKNWFSQIEKGAKERNISVDSALTLNAIWTLEHK